jgi:hypothetical protein
MGWHQEGWSAPPEGGLSPCYMLSLPRWVWRQDHRRWLGAPNLLLWYNRNWFLVHATWVPSRTLLMSDEVKTAPQLRIGLINEILSQEIFVTVDHAPWECFCSSVGMLRVNNVPSFPLNIALDCKLRSHYRCQMMEYGSRFRTTGIREIWMNFDTKSEFLGSLRWGTVRKAGLELKATSPKWKTDR